MIYVRHKSQNADVEAVEVPEAAFDLVYKAKGWQKVADPDTEAAKQQEKK